MQADVDALIYTTVQAQLADWLGRLPEPTETAAAVDHLPWSTIALSRFAAIIGQLEDSGQISPEGEAVLLRSVQQVFRELSRRPSALQAAARTASKGP
jgi:hypothetical protein